MKVFCVCVCYVFGNESQRNVLSQTSFPLNELKLKQTVGAVLWESCQVIGGTPEIDKQLSESFIIFTVTGNICFGINLGILAGNSMPSLHKNIPVFFTLILFVVPQVWVPVHSSPGETLMKLYSEAVCLSEPFIFFFFFRVKTLYDAENDCNNVSCHSPCFSVLFVPGCWYFIVNAWMCVCFLTVYPCPFESLHFL